MEEEAFKRLKLRLRLEAVSGLTHLAFRQDFAAKIVAANFHGLLATAYQSPADGIRPHRFNRTYAIGALRPILVGCLLRVTRGLRALGDALDIIARTRRRIQHDRHYPRSDRVQPHAYLAYKVA